MPPRRSKSPGGTGWTTLTGVGGFVTHEGKLLVIRQRRPYGVHWELPSGYYEPGESYEQAVAREVLEETGIEVEVGELMCTMVWERVHDHRRNVLAYFRATPVDPAQAPRPQSEEEIEAATWANPAELDVADVHPLNRVIIERWGNGTSGAFHVHADVSVDTDGMQSYRFRS